jgi:hypothetical protein
MLSRAEYLDRAGFEDPLSEAEMQRITRPHRLSVEQALKEGREVPKHVLAEYPDLEEKAGELAVGATVASKAQELARAAQTAHRAEELEETAEKVHQTHLAMHATEIAKQEQRDQEKRRVQRDAPPPPIPPPPVPSPAPNLLQTLQGLGGSGMPPGGPPQIPMMPGS